MLQKNSISEGYGLPIVPAPDFTGCGRMLIAEGYGL
jgi:hypothetical protein